MSAAPAGGGLADDLTTPEGAAAAVDRAERSLDQLLGPSQAAERRGAFRDGQATTLGQQAGVGESPGARVTPFAQPPPAAPEPPPPPPPPAAGAARVAPADQPIVGKAVPAPSAAPSAAALDACSTACSALASMERATEHLCSLAGAADARCASARTRVHAATARVHASCPTCGA
jgi:hypothetical protein